jgi:transposase
MIGVSAMSGLVAWAGCGLVIEDLVPDGLWEQVVPLLPAPTPRPYRHHGRRRADDRAAPAGIVFVLRHGVGWRQVPAQSLGVSGVTCWRRLREWTEAGLWPRLHEAVLVEMRRQGLLDLDEMGIDGSHVRALKGETMSARHRSTAPGPGPSTT